MDPRESDTPGETREDGPGEPPAARLADVRPGAERLLRRLRAGGSRLAEWIRRESRFLLLYLLIQLQRLDLIFRRRARWNRLAFAGLALLTAGGIFLSGSAHVLRQRISEYDLSRIEALSPGAVILDTYGERFGRISPKNRKIVSLEELPLHLVDALVATEDERFFEHRGNDFRGMVRAALVNLRAGSIRQGGSTITQQLVRNVFDLRERTLERKVIEIALARRLETRISKEEILERYVNRIYFGSGFWGVGAAAEGYFGKNVSELDLGEAAMLGAIIKCPNPLSPLNDPDAAREARNDTLERMRRAGFLTGDECRRALESETEARRRSADERPSYVLRKIREEARELLGERSPDGLVVETSVDPALQQYAEWQVETKLRAIEATEGYEHRTRAAFLEETSGGGEAPDYLQAALIVIDNASGEVLAAVGSRNDRESEFDRVWRAQRQAGTAFTPFTYAAAFNSGAVTPRSPALDVPIDNREVMIGGKRGILGEWGGETNGSVYEGMIPAAWSFASDKMAATVRIGYETGLEEVKALARRAGITSPLRDFPNTFLGSSEVNLAELTLAYTVFPNLGWRAEEPGLIRRIRTRTGEVLYERASGRRRVKALGSESAGQIGRLLTQMIPGEADSGPGELPSGIGGKGGAAYGFTDHWFVGFHAETTWGVWIGFDQPKRISQTLTSGETAFPLWASLLDLLDAEGSLPTPRACREIEICRHNCARCRDSAHRKLTCVVPLSQGDPAPQPRENGPLRAVPVGEGTDHAKSRTAVRSAIRPRVPPVQGEDPYGALQGWGFQEDSGESD